MKFISIFFVPGLALAAGSDGSAGSKENSPSLGSTAIFDKAEGYTSTVGACRGGDSPGNNAGLQYYPDRDCEARCNADSDCTGFVLPVNGANWCETYTSEGATGDGRDAYMCYMKDDSPPPTFTYEASVGACRGGDSPGNNAGLQYYPDRDCEARCNADSDCTGFVLPVNGANWCETYTSEGATGDGRSAYTCYMKTDPVPANPPTYTPTESPTSFPTDAPCAHLGVRFQATYNEKDYDLPCGWILRQDQFTVEEVCAYPEGNAGEVCTCVCGAV